MMYIISRILPIVLVSLAVSLPVKAQLVRFQQNNKVGYKDASGHTVAPPMYEAGSEMKEGFAIILKGDKRGYINARGEESLPCIYEDASLFENGLACVKLNGKYGYINKKAAWAIQPIYDNAFTFKNGLARVNRAQKWGMINVQGTVVIPMIYERLYDLSDGLIPASLDGVHYGYIDASGKVVLDFQYYMSLPFNEKDHKGIVHMSDGAYYINKKGALLSRIESEEERERRERKGEKGD